MQFIQSVYYFSHKLSEDWHLNVVKDISQEAWKDFIGFIENKFSLDLCNVEINRTYQNIRRFDLKANINDLQILLKYFIKHLEPKSEDKAFIVQHEVYQFLLSFVFDQTNNPFLTSGLKLLFSNLIINIHSDYQQFQQLVRLIPNFENYVNLINILSKGKDLLSEAEQIYSQLQEEIVVIFLEHKLDQEAYQSIQNLNFIKNLIINGQQSLFQKEYENCIYIVFSYSAQILTMIDQSCIGLIETIKLSHIKQDLISTINFYYSLGSKHDQEQYRRQLIRQKISLSDVNFRPSDLIECLKKLDDSELVYYLLDLLDSILIYVSKNMNEFSADDWCLTFYISYKYLVKDSSDPDQYNQWISVLKQYIKIHYMTNYRRAIPVQSSFYKILSIVEMETFFADDLINYY